MRCAWRNVRGGESHRCDPLWRVAMTPSSSDALLIYTKERAFIDSLSGFSLMNIPTALRRCLLSSPHWKQFIESNHSMSELLLLSYILLKSDYTHWLTESLSLDSLSTGETHEISPQRLCPQCPASVFALFLLSQEAHSHLVQGNSRWVSVAALCQWNSSFLWITIHGARCMSLRSQ